MDRASVGLSPPRQGWGSEDSKRERDGGGRGERGRGRARAGESGGGEMEAGALRVSECQQLTASLYASGGSCAPR